ncbi:unnamed protein product [Gordionus sp. m RMFG-2023]
MNEEFFRNYSKDQDFIELINKMKNTQDSYSTSEINLKDLQKQCNFWLLGLKKFNRMAQIKCKNIKDKTSDIKQKVDEKYLVLQNLLYQVNYLKQEIKNCINCPTLYEDLDILPWQQFFEIMPEYKEIGDKIIIDDDSSCDNLIKENNIDVQHKLALARLDCELEERKALAQNIEKLLVIKQDIQNNIMEKSKLLDSIYPSLKQSLKETLLVQKLFGLDFEKDYLVSNMVRALPTPLYSIYAKYLSYKKLYNDKEIHFDIYEEDLVNENSVKDFLVALSCINVEKSNSDLINTASNLPNNIEETMDESDSKTHYLNQITVDERNLADVKKIVLHTLNTISENDDFTIPQPIKVKSVGKDKYGRHEKNEEDNRHAEITPKPHDYNPHADLKFILSKSNLTLKITVACEDNLDNDKKQIHMIELIFRHYPNLNIVTASFNVKGEKPKLSKSVNERISVKDDDIWSIMKQNLLTDILDDSSSSISLSPIDYMKTNFYIPKLVKVIFKNKSLDWNDKGIEEVKGKLEDLITTLNLSLEVVYDKIGYPYQWLQYVNEGSIGDVTSHDDDDKLMNIFAVVKSRFQSRIHLYKLIAEFKSLSSTNQDSNNFGPLKKFDINLLSSIQNFSFYLCHIELVLQCKSRKSLNVSITLPNTTEYYCSHIQQNKIKTMLPNLIEYDITELNSHSMQYNLTFNFNHQHLLQDICDSDNENSLLNTNFTDSTLNNKFKILENKMNNLCPRSISHGEEKPSDACILAIKMAELIKGFNHIVNAESNVDKFLYPNKKYINEINDPYIKLDIMDLFICNAK